MQLRHFFFASLCAFVATGCPEPIPYTHDASTTDAPMPDIDAPDAPPPKPKRRGGVVSTSGGGVTASAQHRLRVRIGAPQPVGRTSSPTHHLVTGPGALP